MITILVVDDMSLCREPLEFALQSKGYRTLSAANGLEALAQARQSRPDLILLDVGMPVMDGLRCLKALRADSTLKTVPVLMLTDSSDRDVVVDAIRVGIQGYLLKSALSFDELLSRVEALTGDATIDSPPAAPEPEHAAAIDNHRPPVVHSEPPRSLSKNTVLRQVRQKLQLRAMPPVLHHVMALTNSQNSSLDEIAKAISQDQSLALRLMKVANSSYYSAEKSVGSAMEAAQRIGLTEVQNMIVAILAIEHFDSSTPAGLVPQRFWEHSLGTASLAQLICEALEFSNRDQICLAALLHDLGRMILADVYPEQYKWALETVAQRSTDLTVIEEELFGLSHVDVTREILKGWKLPDSVIDNVTHHELEVEQIKQNATEPQEALVVALANRLAHALAIGNSGAGRLMPIRAHVLALDLAGEAVHSIAEHAVEKTANMELLYASRTEKAFLPRAAEELVRDGDTDIRLAVLSEQGSADPMALFCEQLGWIDAVQPRLVVLCAQSERDLARRFDQLIELEELQDTRCGVVVISPGSELRPSKALLGDRPCRAIAIPASYARVMDTVAEVQQCLASNAPTASLS